MVLSKMADDLNRAGDNVVVWNQRERGLGVHRNVPYKFSITYSRQDVDDTLFASLAGSM